METQIKMRLFGSNLFTFCVFESSSDASIIISGGKSSPKLSLPKKTFFTRAKVRRGWLSSQESLHISKESEGKNQSTKFYSAEPSKPKIKVQKAAL